MGLFGKTKNSNCCTVQFEEIKVEKDKKSSCCDIKIEEVKDEDQSKKSNDACCPE